MGSQGASGARTMKRLIVCCDGTWMNSDNGYKEPSAQNPQPSIQVPSNVTRISRCFKRRCNDGTLQIISYESGVGTGSNAIDTLTGGAFGLGLTEVCRVSWPQDFSTRKCRGKKCANSPFSVCERHTPTCVQTT